MGTKIGKKIGIKVKVWLNLLLFWANRPQFPYKQTNKHIFVVKIDIKISQKKIPREMVLVAWRRLRQFVPKKQYNNFDLQMQRIFFRPKFVSNVCKGKKKHLSDPLNPSFKFLYHFAGWRSLHSNCKAHRASQQICANFNDGGIHRVDSNMAIQICDGVIPFPICTQPFTFKMWQIKLCVRYY